MDQIKIITINTWKCDGDYYKRMGVLAAQLKLLSPDIIACQECFYSEEAGADTLKYLAEKLDMTYTFLPGRFKKRYFEHKWANSASGLGILSAWPVTDVKHFDLPVVPGDEDRKALQAVIVFSENQNITVTNTHLTHLGNSTGLRQKQAEAIADIAKSNTQNRYNLVCGDFNAVIGSDEMKTLIKKAGAIDCYFAGNGDEPRYSLADAFTDNKLICVDHIFALPYPGESVFPEIIDSEIVLNSKDKASGIYPSDHFGISTTIIID